MKIAWATDIHLDFLEPEGRAAFAREVGALAPDAVALTGDLATAPLLAEVLTGLAAEWRVPVYFVLGNHDFYHGSIARVRAEAERLTYASPLLRWMPLAGVVSLTAHTALVGHDGWADARLGDFDGSRVFLNDYLLIEDLAGLAKGALRERLGALGDEAAAYLADAAREALKLHRHVVVLTHVPPWREACWHRGRPSGDEWLPHFACGAVGEALEALMRDRPDRTMTVLCGHTHSPGEAWILPNLLARTGGAAYGSPVAQPPLRLP